MANPEEALRYLQFAERAGSLEDMQSVDPLFPPTGIVVLVNQGGP